MGEIVNLRQARKQKARAAKEKDAEANRIKFGRTKADKDHGQAAKDFAARRLDQSKLTPDE